MSRMLITPTLLNSFAWYRDFEVDEETCLDIPAAEKKSRDDFLNTLRRMGGFMGQGLLNGIMLEKAVERYCKGSEPISQTVKEIGDIVKGGKWQVSVKKEMGQFLLYGKTDVMKADTIYDVKFCQNYDIGKYQASAQHRIYLYCSGLPKFSYIPGNEWNWWREDYFNHDKIEAELKLMIDEFMNHLTTDDEARELFETKWIALA